MKIKNLTFGTILLSLAALVNLARWTGLFTFSDHAPVWVREVIPVLDTISGLFTGLAIAGSLAFVSHRLGMLQPFTPKGKPIMRFWGALVSELLILVLSAFLLPPYIRMTTPAELRAEIGDLRTWSVMAVLVGDLIIVAIALADGKSAGFTRSKPQRPQTTRSAKPSKRTPTKNKIGATDSNAVRRTYPRKCEHCTEMIRTPNAVGGHMKKHHPELCKPKQSLAEVLFVPADEKVTRK